MFLANMGIIATIGKSYNSIFGALLDMQACIDSLRHITLFLNQPTDLVERLLASRKRREKTIEMKNELKEQYPEVKNILDLEPILLKDIEFNYSSNHDKAGQPGFSRVNLLGNIQLQQGSFSAFVGPRCEGKTTLLRILCSVMLPDSGICFIPSHLRVLHVAAETCFYRGTLLENLTFGVNKSNPDSSPDHVRRILERLGVTRRLLYYLEGEQQMPWSEILSQTECQILNLARAFVFNPEVLCIDNPGAAFDDVQRQVIMKILKDFVTSKGVEQNPETAAMRRPRTCALATDRTNGLEEVDQIFTVSYCEGVKQFKDMGVHS